MAAKSSKANTAVVVDVDVDVKKGTDNLKKLSQAFDSAFKGIGIAASAAKLYDWTSAATKELFHLNSQLMGTENALKAVGKSSLQIEDDLSFLRTTSQTLGTNFNQLSRSYAKLEISGRNLGLSTSEVRDILVSTSEASVVTHASAQDVFLIFNALEQIMAKGKVQSEEIVRQFAQRVPGGFTIAANAIGVTTAEFSKLLKVGGVDPQAFFRGLPEAITKMFGAALPAALETSLAKMNIFYEKLDNVKRRLASELEPVFKAVFVNLGIALDDISNRFETAELGKAVRSMLSDATHAVADFVEGFEKNVTVAKYGLVGLIAFGAAGPAGAGIALAAMGMYDKYQELVNPTPFQEAANAVKDLRAEIASLENDVKTYDNLGAEHADGGHWAREANAAEAAIATAKKSLGEWETKLEAIPDPAKSVSQWLHQLADDMNAMPTKIPALEIQPDAPPTYTEGGPLWGLKKMFEEAEDEFTAFDSMIKKWETDTTNAIWNVATEGAGAFEDMIKSMIEDLAKLAIQQMIVQPMFDLAVAPPTKVSSQSVSAKANGEAFSFGGNVIPFAKGGIVNSTTGFTFGGGRQGVMGEAGPEAIMPLSRGRDGKLGVLSSGGGGGEVVVNVYNQSGGETEVKTSSGADGMKTIDVYILKTVASGMSSGAFDKSMSSSFGVNRRGS